VTNGTFDTDTTGWTAEVGVDATVTSGEVQLLNTAAGTGRNFYQTVSTEVGKVYSVSYYCQKTPGGTTIVFAGDSAGSSTGGDQQTVLEDGNSSFVFTAGQTSTYITCRIGGTDGQGAIFDNVSVKEVLFDDASGTLTLFNHPADVPRIEYDASGNVLGLLVEESRTNDLPDSNLAGWSTIRSVLTLNAGVAPDGSVTATKLDKGAGPGSRYILKTLSLVDRSVSVFAKAGEASHVQLAATNTTTSYVSFDLSSGTAADVGASITSYGIDDVGGGWYRCWAYLPTSANGSTVIAIPNASNPVWLSDPGDSPAGGIYIWGAQAEAGSFPTSYIPTAGATATRSADVASIPVADFGYNQSEGSVVVEFDYKSYYNSPRLFSLDQQSNANFEMLGYVNTSGVPLWFVNDNGVTQANSNSGVTLGSGGSKAAVAYAVNDCAISVDGSSPVLDGLASIPTVDQLRIGREAGSSSQLNGHIKSIRYYPRRLTDAQLQELTT
jgi:hypothetical protein